MTDDVVGDLKTALEVIDRAVERYDHRGMVAVDMLKVLGIAESLSRSAAALRMKVARGIEQSKIHEDEGRRNADELIAGVTGQPVGKATETLGLARALEAHPVIQAAFNKGKLSESQARQIASAADVDPAKAKGLIVIATKKSYGELKEACQRIRSKKQTGQDADERYKQMRKRRCLRTWIDHEGFGRLEATLMADSLGVLRSALKPFEEQMRDEHRKSDDYQSHAVYAADALVAMAIATTTGAGTAGAGATTPTNKPRRNNTPLVRIRVDYDALVRGHTEAGETSEIIGGGDIPPSLAAGYAKEALLELIATKGIDVYKIVTNTRHISKVLDIALEERDRTCCHSGCDVTYPLQRDHDIDFAKDGPTSLENLNRTCPRHHAIKTRKKWRWEGTLGNMRLVPPEHPREDGSGSPAARGAPASPGQAPSTRKRGPTKPTPTKRTPTKPPPTKPPPKQQSLLSEDGDDP
jgi:hypothetical protein